MAKQHEPQLLLHRDRARLLVVGVALDHFEKIVNAGAVGNLLLWFLRLFGATLQIVVLLIRSRRMHAQYFFVAHPNLLVILHFSNTVVYDQI